MEALESKRSQLNSHLSFWDLESRVERQCVHLRRCQPLTSGRTNRLQTSTISFSRGSSRRSGRSADNECGRCSVIQAPACLCVREPSVVNKIAKTAGLLSPPMLTRVSGCLKPPFLRRYDVTSGALRHDRASLQAPSALRLGRFPVYHS